MVWSHIYSKGSHSCTFARQKNYRDCGMSVAGFALSVALGLDITSAPAEYPSQLRARWHDAIEAGIKEQQCITLDKTFLA